MTLNWFIVTKDDTEIQHSSDFSIKDAIAKKPKKFVLYDESNGKPFNILHLDDGRKKLIYVRRVDITAGRGFKVVCHITGWHMKVGGESVQAINYVFETIGKPGGELMWIESAGKFQDGGWFYAPADKTMKEVLGIEL